MTNLSCWNAAATLGATLAEWQRRREEEEAARRAAMFSGGGGDEDEEASDVAAKKRAKVIAKNQAKRNQEQAWENAWTAQKTQQAQNAITKNNNLAQAEAEMGKVKPVTPYVASAYIDKDEEKRLKGQESQRAWAAVNAQEQAKPWWQRVGESVSAFAQTEVNKFQTWNSIRNHYGWTPIGIFSQQELNTFAETGKDITNYVDTLSPGNGQAWVKSYIPANIIHWPLPLTFLGEKFERLEVFTRPMGLPGTVILPNSWEKNYSKEKNYSNPKSMPLIHEFGHVWDARTGNVDLPYGIVNGVADQLNTFIGGTVVEQNGSRFLDESGYDYILDEEYWYGKDESSDYEYKLYAQNSTADYLCETLNALIYDTQAFPKPEVGQWVETVIKLQADNLGKAANANSTVVAPIPAPTAPPATTPIPSQTPEIGGRR